MSATLDPATDPARSGPIIIAPASRPRRPRKVFAAGWRPDMPPRAYHADPCPTPSLSSHVAMTVIQKSLMHAWRRHPKSPDFEEQVMPSAADRGSAAHALLFGGQAFVQVDADDWRTAAARQARDGARAAGNIPILAREMPSLEAMVAPAQERLRKLHGGDYLAEQTALWRDAKSGGWRRARLDTLSASKRLIVDYKTTEAAVDAWSCERRIAEMGLQIQAAAYVDAVEALHPELMGRVRFIFQWQEQKAPYALSPPIEMSEAFMTLGRMQWRAAGELWDKAVKQNAFPGHSREPHIACPPAWQLAQWEERAFNDPALRKGGGR